MLFFYIKKGSEKQRGQLAKLQWMDQGCNWGRGALGGRAPPAFHTLAKDMSKHRDTTHFTPGSRPCIISSFLLLIYLCPRLRPWNGQKDNQIKLPEGVAYRIYKWKGSASHTTKNEWMNASLWITFDFVFHQIHTKETHHFLRNVTFIIFINLIVVELLTKH